MKYFYLSCLMLIVSACQTIPLSYSPKVPSIDVPKDTIVNNDYNVSSKPKLDGLYYGVSDNELGRRAWLLRLGAGKGVLYMPPNNLAIPKVEISDEVNISFRSEPGLAGNVYNFTGRYISNSIQGTFKSASAQPSDSKTRSFAVTLQKVNVSSLNENDPDGLYSNVDYVEEGGDLVGEDLILISSGEELLGAYASYENEMIPYAVNVKRAGNKLKFNIKTENQEQDFKVIISPKKIKLLHNDVSADPEAEPTILSKQKRLGDFLIKFN